MVGKSIAGIALLLQASTSTAAPIDPFAILRDAYAKRDAELAATAYGATAQVVYRYDKVPIERFTGHDAIRASFAQLFADLPRAAPLDLNFRVTRRDGARITGYYRLRAGPEAVACGTFVARTGPDGRFESDESGSATCDDFEEAEGPVLLAPDDEELDRAYYAGLTGRYRLTDGCDLVVTRSVRRLFVRNTCTQEWRGLERTSGRTWSAGRHVIDAAVVTRYAFALRTGALSQSLTVQTEDEASVTARRGDQYDLENVRFASTDGTQLAGTLYKPRQAGRRPAIVLIHGSGPQDRDGYASIIAVLADAFAAQGRLVLTYDKRGTGSSQGDGDRANFGTLADDAMAGMRLLAVRGDVDPLRIGLGGSSQAGWVAAQAIKAGARPADVFLLGAAGAALTVRAQNLFNTEVLMACQGIAAGERNLALAQQQAFFDFVANPDLASRLDRATRAAAAHPVLTDWLFPDSHSIDRTGGAWYTVLDPAFDPLPIWRKYPGRAVFAFGSLDDSTPTDRAVRRLSRTGPRIRILPEAQHLGLIAKSRCDAGLDRVQRFSPQLFMAINEFAR